MRTDKDRKLERYDRGQCRSCENPRDNESASCPVCRDKNRRKSAAAYWQNGRERKRVFRCNECDKPGHNVVTCAMAKR